MALQCSDPSGAGGQPYQTHPPRQPISGPRRPPRENESHRRRRPQHHLASPRPRLRLRRSRSRFLKESDRKQIEEFAGRVDAAIVGLGTCGSCTTFTIKDAVTVEEHEKPVVAVVCEEFTVHAHNVARHVGHADMNVLVLPYPLEARPTEELQQIAQDYYPKVLELLGVTA